MVLSDILSAPALGRRFDYHSHLHLHLHLHRFIELSLVQPGRQGSSLSASIRGETSKKTCLTTPETVNGSLVAEDISPSSPPKITEILDPGSNYGTKSQSRSSTEKEAVAEPHHYRTKSKQIKPKPNQAKMSSQVASTRAALLGLQSSSNGPTNAAVLGKSLPIRAFLFVYRWD